MLHPGGTQESDVYAQGPVMKGKLTSARVVVTPLDEYHEQPVVKDRHVPPSTTGTGVAHEVGGVQIVVSGTAVLAATSGGAGAVVVEGAAGAMAFVVLYARRPDARCV